MHSVVHPSATRLCHSGSGHRCARPVRGVAGEPRRDARLPGAGVGAGGQAVRRPPRPCRRGDWHSARHPPTYPIFGAPAAHHSAPASCAPDRRDALAQVARHRPAGARPRHRHPPLQHPSTGDRHEAGVSGLRSDGGRQVCQLPVRPAAVLHPDAGVQVAHLCTRQGQRRHHRLATGALAGDSAVGPGDGRRQQWRCRWHPAHHRLRAGARGPAGRVRARRRGRCGGHRAHAGRRCRCLIARRFASPQTRPVQHLFGGEFAALQPRAASTIAAAPIGPAVERRGRAACRAGDAPRCRGRGGRSAHRSASPPRHVYGARGALRAAGAFALSGHLRP
eukprot:ctg_321.g97